MTILVILKKNSVASKTCYTISKGCYEKPNRYTNTTKYSLSVNEKRHKVHIKI